MTAFADAGYRADEYRAAVDGAAIFAAPAGRLRLVGADARDLLNRLSTNLVDPDAAPGSVDVTVLTSDRGRIVDLVYVAHCGDCQLMLTSPGQQAAVIEFLDKYTIMEDLEVEDVSGALAMFTVTGPAAGDVLRRALPVVDDLTVPGIYASAGGDDAVPIRLIVPPSHPDGDGAEFYLLADGDDAATTVAALESAGAVRISDATAEALRIARRRPRYGAEMSDTYNPLEAGLIGAIDFHKGCYIGQEVIARLDTYEKVQKYLVALRFQIDGGSDDSGSDGPDGLAGAQLVDGAGKAMGLVTSVARLPGADGDGIVGLGYVRTAAAEIGNVLDVSVRDGNGAGIKAEIAARPQLFGGEKPPLGE